jgi:hypothetical protein
VLVGLALIAVIVVIAVGGDDDEPRADATSPSTAPTSLTPTPHESTTTSSQPPTPTSTPKPEIVIPPLLVQAGQEIFLLDVATGQVGWNAVLHDRSTLSPDNQNFAEFNPGDAVESPSVEIFDLVDGGQATYEVPREPREIFLGSAYDWSPDGQFLAYLDETGEDVHVLDTRVGDVTSFGIRDSPISEWSPTSSHLLVCVDEYPTQLILVPAGGEPVTISGDGSRWEDVDCDWTWSDDGSYLTMLVGDDVTTLWTADYSEHQITGFPADVGKPLLANCPALSEMADAVIRGRSDEGREYFAIDGETGTAERVTSPPCEATVSPDGTAWAWASDDDELFVGSIGQDVDDAVSPTQPGTRVGQFVWLNSGELLFDAEGGLFTVQADGANASAVQTPDRVDDWWYYPASDRLALGGSDSTVLLDETFTQVGTLDPRGWITDGIQALSADGRFLALPARSGVPVIDLSDATLFADIDLSDDFVDPLVWITDSP